MALFKRGYSGLITKGLGMPGACCGLITMGFALFKCTVEVVNIPSPGGGGGHVPITYQSLPPRHSKDLIKTKLIKIDVRINTKHWRVSYPIDDQRAKYAIKIISIINRIKDGLTVRIDKIRSTLRTIKITFK